MDGCPGMRPSFSAIVEELSTLRLAAEERRLLRLLEAALSVSEYTGGCEGGRGTGGVLGGPRGEGRQRCTCALVLLFCLLLLLTVLA